MLIEIAVANALDLPRTKEEATQSGSEPARDAGATTPLWASRVVDGAG